MLIELCKISKLVMHLNSCSMDLGRDSITCIHVLQIRLEFAPRNTAIPTPSCQSHEPLIHSHLITTGEQGEWNPIHK